jgi:hypothetical protein
MTNSLPVTPSVDADDAPPALTGVPCLDEAIYLRSEYTYAERTALELGYPIDTPLSVIYADLQDEEDDFDLSDHDDPEAHAINVEEDEEPDGEPD